jgi:hypothetical protein
MSYYDHATMIAYRLGPWAQAPEPPLDVPAGRRRQEHALVTGPSRGKKMRVGKNSVSNRLGGFWTRISARVRQHRPEGQRAAEAGKPEQW